MENFIYNQYGGKNRYFKHQKYQNILMINKVRGNLNAICLRFLPHVQKFEFLISQSNVSTCRR